MKNQIQYIDSDVIVNDVKNRMGSYFNSNKVDDSIFPRILRKCVGYMGLKVYPEKKAFLVVSGSKALLPKDFKRLSLALACYSGTRYLQDPRQVHTQEQIICDWNDCDLPTEVWQDCDGNMFKIVQTINLDKFEFREFEVLRPSRGSFPGCDKNCFNLGSRSSNEFELRERNGQWEMLTNFENGQIYVEYFADLEQEFGFKIPDNEKVKDWIFEELRKEVYSYLYDNGEDVMQRLNESKQELVIKHAIAQEIYNRREVSEYYNTANRLARRYSAMEKWIQGSKVYSR